MDRSRAPQLMRFTATGTIPTLAELEALCRAEISAGTLTAATRALIDLRGVTEMPDLAQVQSRAERSTNKKAWPLRRAYLVLPGAQYGVARQIQAFSPEAIQIQIFTEEEPAWAWLLSDDQPA